MSAVTSDPIHDVVAIGVGPFNLGLAALAAPLTELSAVFLEARPDFSWHPGMLLDGATVQTPFLSDLVTLADPTSPYSFLSWLKQTGRLYAFYIREDFHPLRAEFDAYCRWVAGRLPSVRFDQQVVDVSHSGVYEITAQDRNGATTVHRGRRLVLGTGTPPWVPQACAPLLADDGRTDTAPVLHNRDYRARRAELLAAEHVTVVGSGQSAAEIYLDLLDGLPERGQTLEWITRSPRFFPLEYTKLTLELTSPDYLDYFHALPAPTRDRLVGEQRALYKGISAETIDAIHDLLYRRSLDGPLRTRLRTGTAVVGARRHGGRVELDLEHTEQGRRGRTTTAALVLATGYRYRVPEFLDPVRDRISWDSAGRFAVRRDYAIDAAGTGEILVQNAELHTHGFIAPDLGMAAYRNATILRGICGREVYPIEKSIAFQEFGLVDGEPMTEVDR